MSREWIRHTVISFVCAGFALLGAAEANAQAWIHEPGSGYGEVSFRTISGDQFFGSEGEVRDLRTTYSQSTLQLYGEVGVVPRWLQVVVDGEIFRYNELARQGATSGLGDMRLGLWTGLYQRDVKISAGLRTEFPTGDPEPSAPGDNPQTEIIANSLPTGDGAFDLAPSLAVGYGVGGENRVRSYLTGVGRYAIRFGGRSDAVEWRAEVGVQFPFPVLNRFWFAGRIRGLHPLSDSSGRSFSGLSGGAAHVSPGFSMRAEIFRGFGLQGSLEGAMFARNIVAAVPVQFGAFYNF